ncbi:MAG TPA: XdhC family protein [Ktedonobacterales bacterium]|jgi:xanthine dehydrogenase accessory factor
MRDILDEVQRLRAERRPFALATVVAANQPTSGTPGARAIITSDAKIEGWVGGHCAQPTVVRQSLAALADGLPRLVVLGPDAELDVTRKSGIIPVTMTCAGQGELQIFVEPFLPKVELVVVGSSPVARTLARLGSLLDFEVWACDPDADMQAFPGVDRLVESLEALKPQLTARNYVVVATFGAYDEAAIQAALESPASYVGLVASKKRMAAIQAFLEEQGVSAEQLLRLKRPQGLPGRALQPGEIAFSVMAALLDIRRQRIGLSQDELPAPRAEAIDPICGMTVDIATATYKTERNGQMYYFCCAGCQAKFEAS